jgi:hypothetical protein
VTDKVTIRLVGQSQRDHACAIIQNKAPQGYVVTIQPETRTQAQNRLMWPLISDMRQQIEGMDAFTPEQTKLRFMNLFDNEMQMLPELEGGGSFVVGQRSSQLTKPQFRNLIEIMFAYGAKYEVRWSAKSSSAIDEILTRK